VSFSPSSSSLRPPSHQQRAFSLVEVVLAIGVVSFAFVALMGLLPAGMQQFRKAIDTTVAAEIAQRVIDDAQQTDFDTLLATPWPSYRYFDERGVEVIPINSGASSSAALLSSSYPAPPQQSEQQKVVYQVNTRVVAQTILPDGTQAAVNTLATVTVQVLNNPGFVDPTQNVDQSIPPLFLPSPHYSLLTFCAQIAPNTFSNQSNY